MPHAAPPKTRRTSTSTSTGKRTPTPSKSSIRRTVSTPPKTNAQEKRQRKTEVKVSTPPAERREASSRSRRKGGVTSREDDSPIGKSPSDRALRTNEKFGTVKKTIEDIGKHLTDEKRGAKLANACAEFDHWDELKHNAELHYGAANVLALAITMTTDNEELRMICAALEMIFRASPSSVKVAFDKVEHNLIPWLLQIMTKCESGKMKYAEDCILNISRTILSFSRVPELRMRLARHKGMMTMLVRASSSLSGIDSRVARVKLLSNLVNSDENKLFFAETKGMIDCIMRIAALDVSETAREYASTAIMDLASCPENQVPMAKSDKLLGTIVKLAVVETVPETRESAISALQNLAFCQQNRVRLVSYSNGVVLEALIKIISKDPNDKARRRAAGALTNLACEETVEKMGNHRRLLETLAIVSSKDTNMEVQTRASMALTKIATAVTLTAKCYKTLLDALVVASLSHKNHNSVSSVLRSKAREPENRESMARHPGILDTLTDICVSDCYPIKDRDNAMRAIMHLTNEDENRKIMCHKTVLSALVTVASIDGDKFSDMRESAIIAMERLATDTTNRPLMARHKGLITAVAKNTEREEAMLQGKDGVDDTPVHDRLAKPLLMSLLLAL